MKVFVHLTTLSAIALASLLLSGCSTSGAQDLRTSNVERRQDRMDSRTSGRMERREIRGEREDARAAARFDSW